MSASTNATSATDEAFADWRRELDSLCRRKLSLSVHDLPAMPAREAFDADKSAKEFFHETVVPRLREEHGSFVDELLAEVIDPDDIDTAPEAA